MNILSDILIIGGGIVGLSLAIELKLRGANVTVLTRDFQQAATHAAAGMLAPQAEQLPPSPMLDLCLRSRALYPDWTNKLEQITGTPTGFWPCGILSPAYDIQERASNISSEQKVSGKSPVSIWLDKEAIHQHQPGLSSEVVGGWWYPEDGQVDNRALAITLWAAAQQLGIHICEGVNVEEIQTQNKQVIGVKTSAGDWQAQQYIFATGPWSNQLLPVPVYPKKGQMLSVRVPLPSLASPPSPEGKECFLSSPSLTTEKVSSFSSLPLTVGPEGSLPLKQVLFGSEIYIVPRRDGRIIIGATSEDVGFAPYNTTGGIQALLARAIRLYPELQHFPIQELWWGFRPTTPDELPILGGSAYDNLTLATGHYRNGILLAPITAFLIADVILEQKHDPLLNHFHYSRFSNTQRYRSREI
ncbi:glycine oxidase ThiO [Aerosakkonema funiforme]|uniref:glycine oxidase ThiO n=1 Tax=Aerosakkonema funiforme TaxID=1246630 RepID=UPI0035B73807